MLLVLSSGAAEPRRAVEEPQLRMDRLDVDRIGLEQPLDEEAVERGECDDRETAALGRVRYDLAQALLEHVADRSIELSEAHAHLRPLLDALEDEPEDEPPQL